MVHYITSFLLFLSSSATTTTMALNDGEFNKSAVSLLAQETLTRMLGIEDDAVVRDEEEVAELRNKKNMSVPTTATAAEDDDTDTSDTTEETESTTKTANNEESKEAILQEERGQAIIEWINSNGGLIHSNARIGLDPTGQYRGVFVKTLEEGGTVDGIEDGDIVGRIPWDLIVKPDNYADNIFWSCEALHKMYEEFKLGDESKHAPYINYLKHQPRGLLPAEWSDAGRKLLEETIQGHSLQDSESESMWRKPHKGGLPPEKHLKEFIDTYVGECGGEDTPLARAAFYQFTSRDEDTLMVPFYDMHNHSNNPKLLNTISEKPGHKGDSFILRAIRDIQPGEQIIISYNRCHKCWHDETYQNCDSYSHYGTSEVFDIFGFVEDYPQYWKFSMNVGTEERPEWDDVEFCLERPEDDGPLVLTFGDNYTPRPEDELPLPDNIEWMGKQLIRLKEVEETLKEDKELMNSMPKYEWDTAWRYHEALMTSLSAAVIASDDEEEGSDDMASGDAGDDSEDDYDSEDDSSDDASSDDESGDDEELEDEKPKKKKHTQKKMKGAETKVWGDEL